MRDPKDPPDKKEWLRVWLPLTLLVVAGFAIAIAQLEPPPPGVARMACGSPGGTYYDLCLKYQEVLKSKDFELHIVETAGSMENLDLLRRNEVDFGFVQGGTADLAQDSQKMQSLASVFLEPVWIFQRQGKRVDQLRQLTDQRLIVGPQGSGTRALALQILDANGIQPDAANLIDAGGAEAVGKLLAGEGDVAFFVTSGRSPYLRQLLRSEDVSLLSFERTRAYSTQFRFLSPLILGQGGLDLAENLPSEKHELLASAAMLVAGSELHHALIPLLLDTAIEVHGNQRTFLEEDQLPGAQLSDLPIGKEALHYLKNGPSFLHRYLGFWAASTIDRLKILLLPLITLLFPVFKAAPPLYRWRIRSKIYRWYEDLKQVDEVLGQAPSEEEIAKHVQHLHALESELTEVQVPLSYMDEFYRLRDHVELIRTKLEAQSSGVSRGATTGPSSSLEA